MSVASGQSDVCEESVLLVRERDSASFQGLDVGASVLELPLFGFEAGAVDRVGAVCGEELGRLGFFAAVAAEHSACRYVHVLGELAPGAELRRHSRR